MIPPATTVGFVGHPCLFLEDEDYFWWLFVDSAGLNSTFMRYIVGIFNPDGHQVRGWCFIKFTENLRKAGNNYGWISKPNDLYKFTRNCMEFDFFVRNEWCLLGFLILRTHRRDIVVIYRDGAFQSKRWKVEKTSPASFPPRFNGFHFLLGLICRSTHTHSVCI